MFDSVYETKRRLEIADKIFESYADYVKSGFIVGSVSYGYNTQVRPDSDLDLIFITERLKSILPILFKEYPVEQKALSNRYFDGYCQKYKLDGVDISIHVLSFDALEVVAKAFIANLRLYRNEKKKAEEYCLKGFSGQDFHYHIKTINLPDLSGVRTIVPVSFLDSKEIQEKGTGHDRFYIGVHRHKLLTKPRVLKDDGILEVAVDKLWDLMVEILVDESRRIIGKIDLNQMSILRAMIKNEKFNQDILDYINDRTRFHLNMLK